jgi:bacterioferritin
MSGNPAGSRVSLHVPASGTDTPRRGDPKTIEFLNLQLKNELTSINQYFLHARMLNDWGVTHLAKHEYDESIDEMRHADTLIERILFLGGLPNLQYLDKLLIGEDVREVLLCDLKIEEKAMADLRNAIEHCEQQRDYISREIFERILESEEEHVDYIETQLRLIHSMGIANYIQLQTKPNESAAMQGGD